jgi:hypothetical protein
MYCRGSKLHPSSTHPEDEPMTCSAARLAANRKNAASSTGPKTPEGKERSRQNGLKHGLSGEGIVVPEGDQEEIRRRTEELTGDLKPRSAAGAILIVQMATLSVRFERAAEQESAQTSMRTRHAAEDFDDERIDRVNQLFQGLADDPRTALRKLRRMPEGVERLVDAWQDLRADLTIEPEPDWTDSHLEQAAHLAGLKARHARGSRLGALSRAVRGDFGALEESDGGGLDETSRRDWAKARLLERIDAEVAELVAHHETLDFETLAIDRAEAGIRAWFDPSKPAALARRYESEANRGFFKALQEFRRVEAEFEAEAEAEVTPAISSTARPVDGMGSSREMPAPPERRPSRAFPELPTVEAPAVRGVEDRSSRPIRPAGTSG